MKEREQLLAIYDRLYDFYGSRHWWPAETPFEVIIGALLTQFVSWKNVETAINNLKQADILRVEGILQTDTETLENLIRSTRFYKQKAARLKEMCAFLRDTYDSSISKMASGELQALRKQLLAIKGVGKETADSILLYAAEKPIFVVDKYTSIIFSRLGIFTQKDTYDSMQAYFMRHLEKDTRLYNEYHALIDHLGNRICIARAPRCMDCPLSDICPKL